MTGGRVRATRARHGAAEILGACSDSMPSEKMLEVEMRADGYFNATKLCKKTGKRWDHYLENQRTEELLKDLSEGLSLPIASGSMPVQAIIETVRGPRGCIWVHPDVLPDLQHWCSHRKRKQTTCGYVYAVTSDVLDAVKIGMWSGSLDNLRARYLTPYGPTVTMASAFVEDCVRAEAALHKKFLQHNLGGELFHKASLQAYNDAIWGLAW